MKVVTPKREQSSILELGDIVIFEGKMFTLTKDVEAFIFLNCKGGGFNGRYDSIDEISEATKKSPAIHNGKASLYRSSEYELHIVKK